MTEEELFFAVDSTVRGVVASAAAHAKDGGLDPAAFERALATALIGRCFDVLTVLHSPDEARAIIDIHARGAVSVATFGPVAGVA